MLAPNQEIYLLIMTCTTTEEIVATINKFQAMSYFLKSSTPGLNHPTTQTTNYAVAAQQVKSVSFASDTRNNIPGWDQNLENKLSDQMTKLTKSINKLTHDRHRNDTYDHRYDDRHDSHKPRYSDGHREEREIMKTMVLKEKDIDLPVDMTLGNQKGIQIALEVKLKNKWMKLSKVQLIF